jgi:ribulose-phosphate 3-epimerase
MVSKPEEVLEDWIATGVASIVAHIEATDDFQKIIDICREKNVSVGLAMKPNTDVEKIEKFVPQVDFIQVMGSQLLGKHGVELDEKSLEVIKSLRMKFSDSIIAIDIGVTEENAQDIISAGVNKIISGGAILNSDNPKEVFKYFESL